MTRIEFSRRGFLATSGAIVVSFAAAPAAAAMRPPAARPAAEAHFKTVALDQVDGFVAVDAAGNVTIFSGKVDLGTGVRTAITQIAAEELSVPLDRVRVVQGDTALTPDQGITWGSLTIQVGGMQIRQACATARELLVGRAAERLAVAREELTTRNGAVVRRSGGKGVPYAKLIGDRRFETKVDAAAPLKDPASYTVVGRPVRRLDIPGKVTGTFVYVQDFKLRGMLHGRVLRPPALKATLQSVDDGKARRVPGYVATVRKGSFLAAVATSEWAAIKGMMALEPTWSSWAGLPESGKLWEHVRGSRVARDEALQTAGDTAAAMREGGTAKVMSATYDFAIHTHGSIGPSCAVADFTGGRLTVWTASQATHLLRQQLANMLSLKADDIRCVYLEGAGCYGRNAHEDAAADAALLAVELGRPVRVQWSRADEHGWDPKGPPTLIDMRAAVDGGDVVGWESMAFIPDRPKGFAVTLVAAELAGLPKDEAFPGNVHQGLAIPYAFPNIKATARWLAETPLKPSWIRTPGRMQNTFANESFIDECATVAGVDPLDFRRRNLKDARGLEMLERLAKLADWKPRTAARAGDGDVARGRGVAYTKYELVRTYVGIVADVAVDRKTGKIRVERCFVAHDCGQIINPDGLRNQIEGNVVQTVSRTLIEEVTFDRSAVTSIDWATYPILTFPDVPDVVIDLIDRPAEKPWGAGEPTAAVVPAAIANAVFDATGVRLRSVPFRPEKVLAGLRAA
ncbi:MAG: xanthine dehydrogenase family protein molybdopterin-binding subunit [Alphaproteobacteria bacterium]|nr:xanthine dehydrogenase family protein molybdopterin-binding subunit [Alphaproteobacteria bacterium]